MRAALLPVLLAALAAGAGTAAAQPPKAGPAPREPRGQPAPPAARPPAPPAARPALPPPRGGPPAHGAPAPTGPCKQFLAAEWPEGERRHLRNVKRLTTAGRNGEAYFSRDGKQLLWTSSRGGGQPQVWVADWVD